MTPESIARLKSNFVAVSTQPRALAARFYEQLFAATPSLRRLFPEDMTSLEGHFEAALAMVIRNLDDMAVLHEPLRDLGAQHVHWGAKPEDYALVREALVGAIRASSETWSEQLETDWRHAITAIAVPMLQGAAVHTAVVAEQMASELSLASSETVD